MTAHDPFFMRQALGLARRGTGRVHPNPLVGAVIVRGSKVLSRGAHEYFGGPHAEVNAIRRLKKIPAGSTLYTTLEPCVHHGKTPPCTDLIKAKKLSRVVIGCQDPNPRVSGKGIRALKKAGIEVSVGVLEEEARALNRDFSQWIRKKIPYVTVKVAQSLDGRIATPRGEPRWITGPKARRFSHGLRLSADAVLVGVNTVLQDDPRLNVRLPGVRRQPLKVVLDGALRTPLSARIFSGGSRANVLIFTTARAASSRLRLLRKKAEVVVVKQKSKGRVDWKSVLRVLGKRGIVHVLVEGGGEVIASALSKKIVNECYVFIAPKILGGKDPVSAAAAEGIRKISKAWAFRRLEWSKVGHDLLLHGIF